MTNQASILVVDDQQESTSLMRIVLEAEGYQVLAAHDGRAGLALLQTKPVDLIIADIAMPGLNGYQLFEAVRHNPSWLAIPFVFLTARAMNSDIRYGKALGADDYLTKPIELEDLLAVVKGKLVRVRQLRQFQDSTAKPQVPSLSNGNRVIQAGALKLNAAQHTAWFHNRAIRLSMREFCVLEMLAHHPHQPVSAQALVKASHGLEVNPVEAGTLVRPLIRSVRRKLGYGIGEMGCIETVRGRGYKLITPQ